jgi:hypothetical protein
MRKNVWFFVLLVTVILIFFVAPILMAVDLTCGATTYQLVCPEEEQLVVILHLEGDDCKFVVTTNKTPLNDLIYYVETKTSGLGLTKIRRIIKIIPTKC